MMIDKRLINTVADSKKMDWHHGVMELGGVNWRDYQCRRVFLYFTGGLF